MSKTSNATGILAQLTGLSDQDVREAWEAAKANHKRLADCPVHLFEPMVEVPVIPGMAPRRWRCVRCLGEMTAPHVGAYRAGYLAAGGAPTALTTIPWESRFGLATPSGRA
jgi:hypothetical protein